MQTKYILSIGVLLLTVMFLALFLAIRFWRELRTERLAKRSCEEKVGKIIQRLKPITDLDAEISALNNHLESLISNYHSKKMIYDRLVQQISIFEDKLAFAEMGVYEPHFDFSDSDDYKKAIVYVKERQKQMIANKTAVICATEWALNGSLAEGQTMINRNIRLTLRAFNGECDAAISNAHWNNVIAMEKRILKAREAIDSLNKSSSISVADEYLALKIEELRLTHEYRERLKIERDERSESARMVREEQKLQKDIERAEEDEARYEALLKKARAEAQSIVGPQLEVFNSQIKLLEHDLEEARAKLVRAQAMAERTRSGYVYIISNVGSFGEDVVKIGLTRRLDPADRILELGDASVPFAFDVHAIIYSDDAPALERALHVEFDEVRINTQNYRKEFFRAKLGDVEYAVRQLAPEAVF